jgi:hypothetical protein
MSNVLQSSQGTLDEFRVSQKSQHASQDAHVLARGLSQLADALPSVSAADKLAGTIFSDVVTTSGTLTAGAVFASFENTGSTDVTVNAKTLKPDKVAVFPTSDGMKLPAIAYNATSGSLTINATYPPA